MADRHTPNPDWQEDDSFESTLTEQPLAAENPTPVLDEDKKSSGGSRTTRILLGALLLTVAGFIWYNYVWQPEPTPQVVVAGNDTGINGAIGQSGLSGPAGVPLVAAGPEQNAQELPLIASPDAPGAADAPGAPEQPGPVDADSDGLVAPLPQPGAAARDLEITELPFLIAQPSDEATGDGIAAEDDPSLTRPEAVRVSVNPFSPVLLPEPVASAELAPPATVPSQAQPQQEQVVEVSIPDGPDQTAITSIAPPAGTVQPTVPAAEVPAVTPPAVTPPAVTPTAVAPMEQPLAGAPAPTSAAAVQSGSSIAQSLPRPLPGPSLSPVPAVLQERRAAEDVPQPNLAQVAAVAEPVTDVDAAVADRVADTDLGIPEVLPPAASRVMPTDGDPLVAGATPLSRYLRDNDVSFTGMVLGPVSQGVFRSVVDPRPVVVGIGQNLPDTEITLTDLRGQQAEFTLSDASQFLTLDLRR